MAIQLKKVGHIVPSKAKTPMAITTENDTVHYSTDTLKEATRFRFFDPVVESLFPLPKAEDDQQLTLLLCGSRKR